MFRPDGIPVRSRLQVTFNEFRNADMEAKEIKRESPDHSKTYEVTDGDTLSSIAGRLLNDLALWRAIAIRNGIDDPRILTAGSRLMIPNLPFRDPETGDFYPANEPSAIRA